VRFQIDGLHTVTFTGSKGTAPPLVVPSTTPAPTVPDATGQPFWWSGTAPVLELNPLLLPQKGGLRIGGPGLHSSGLVRVFSAGKKGPAPYVVTFTKPGVYHYVCAVHGGMKGVVRVVPATASVPPPATVQLRAKAQVQRVAATLRRLSKVKPASPAEVNVGISRPDGAELLTMSPAILKISAGQTVDFVNRDLGDIHTVTFGPEALRSQLEKQFVTPGPGGASLNSQAAYPSEPPATPQPITYTGTNHGLGFLNSGILFPQGTPAGVGPSSFKVTFSTPGVYHYECVVHQHMDGTVVVS
jgi:plastocyanin